MDSVDLGCVGAEKTIDLYQIFHFDEDGIYSLLDGDDANKSYAIFYSDKQVDDLITTLSYYKLKKGQWDNDRG